MNQFFTVKIADFLSLFAVAYSVIPFVFAALYRNTQMILWGLGVLSASALADIIKRGTVGAGAWCKRPAGARNCDMWNRNGDQTGKQGFPSGHVATTAAFWMGATLLTRSWYVAIPGLIAITAMAWARMEKRCHTMVQTMAGAVLGMLVVWVLIASHHNGIDS